MEACSPEAGHAVRALISVIGLIRRHARKLSRFHVPKSTCLMLGGPAGFQTKLGGKAERLLSGGGRVKADVRSGSREGGLERLPVVDSGR